MAKVELHQLSDYQLRTGNLAFALISGTIAHIAIPQSGIVKSVSACIQTVHISLPGLITFEVGGVTLKLGGTTATMTIPDAGSTVGDVHIIEFDATTSAVFEAEDGLADILFFFLLELRFFFLLATCFAAISYTYPVAVILKVNFCFNALTVILDPLNDVSSSMGFS